MHVYCTPLILCSISQRREVRSTSVGNFDWESTLCSISPLCSVLVVGTCPACIRSMGGSLAIRSYADGIRHARGKPSSGKVECVC